MTVHMHSHENQKGGIPYKTRSIVQGSDSHTTPADRQRRPHSRSTQWQAQRDATALINTNVAGGETRFYLVSWRVGLRRPHTNVRERRFLRRLCFGLPGLAAPCSCSCIPPFFFSRCKASQKSRCYRAVLQGRYRIRRIGEHCGGTDGHF